MNAVGIDVSKGKSTVAVMRSFGEVAAKPFEVCHTSDEIRKLTNFLKNLDGEARVVMEYTGKYYRPIARALCEAGLFVSVVHPKLIHSFDNDSIRKIKSDKADAIKIANYALLKWSMLRRFTPEDDTRLLLKSFNRQYNEYTKMKVALKNNLTALLDDTFPSANTLFANNVRLDGHEKWIDFAGHFWHCECVSGLSKEAFTARYNKWCARSGYRGSDLKAEAIYDVARTSISTLPKTEETKRIIIQAVDQLNAISSTLAATRTEMRRLAETLPEYPVVLAMRGVGVVLGPQLIAEIGDVRRFSSKQSLVAFAGVDSPPDQSGKREFKSGAISKRGSPLLRKTLFQIMQCILQSAPADDAVFQFLDRKREEGKHYYVYMVAGCNKFLRIYYARTRDYLNALIATV